MLAFKNVLIYIVLFGFTLQDMVCTTKILLRIPEDTFYFENFNIKIMGGVLVVESN